MDQAHDVGLDLEALRHIQQDLMLAATDERRRELYRALDDNGELDALQL